MVLVPLRLLSFDSLRKSRVCKDVCKDHFASRSSSVESTTACIVALSAI
jgi:hypothetical protein